MAARHGGNRRNERRRQSRAPASGGWRDALAPQQTRPHAHRTPACVLLVAHHHCPHRRIYSNGNSGDALTIADADASAGVVRPLSATPRAPPAHPLSAR